MQTSKVPIPRIGFDPPRYVCVHTASPLRIDGDLGKPAWQSAPWTDDFVDIEGTQNRPAPAQRTRAKMLWDDTFLYVGAELMETRIWGTLTQRDCVIFQDNDFELFFDPTGSTHAYFELETNALGTVWDLLMTKPYRDGGIPVSAFDVKGLQLAIAIDGALNDPGTQSRRWCVEAAIPWASLYVGADRTHHPICPPKPGDCWRANFSRVEWRTEVVEGKIRKVIDPATGQPYPEDNWVWAPTGLIDIHYPELWGFVFFQGDQPLDGAIPEHERVKWTLRQLYYRQHAFRAEQGRFASAAELGTEAVVGTTQDLFQITLEGWSIREDGMVWKP